MIYLVIFKASCLNFLCLYSNNFFLCRSRKAIITIRLEFITLGPRPSENSVLEVVKSMLAANLTTKLTARTVSVSDPVILTNVNYLGEFCSIFMLQFCFEYNTCMQMVYLL